jgi:hypothetical protein
MAIGVGRLNPGGRVRRVRAERPDAGAGADAVDPRVELAAWQRFPF